MSVACPNCGLELTKGARFCRRCGIALGTAIGVEDITETRPMCPPENPNVYHNPSFGTTPVYIPPYSYPAAPATTSGIGKRRRATGLVAVGVALVLSLGVAGIVKNTLHRRSGGSTPAVAIFRETYAGVNFDDAGARELGIPGAFIDSLISDLVPAAKAGLLGGDLIVEMSGQKIESEEDARRVLRRNAPGQEMEVKFIRDGQLLTTKLRLGRRGSPEFVVPARQEGFFGINGGRRVRVSNQSIYGVRLDISRNNPAYLAGLNDGDILVEFNHQPVRTYGELERFIHAASPRSPVDVVYFRNGIQQTATVTMGSR